MKDKHSHTGGVHTHHAHEHSSSKNIAIAFFLNFSFTIIEFVGGFLTNSFAILSDAVHDLGDSFSLALSWYFEKVAKRSPNKRYTYGYKRFSLIGALINSIVLLVGSTIILVKSVERLFNPQEVHAKGMFFLAILGVVINGLAVLKTRKGKGANERVVSLHLLEDVLGWLAVLIVSIVLLFVDVPILDPLLSIGISIFVLYNVYKNLRNVLNVMLQGTPVNVDANYIQKQLLHIPDVVSVHDLHIWSLDSQYNIASLHIVIKKENNNPETLLKIKMAVKSYMESQRVNHTTVEIETEEEECTPCHLEI